ncbi:phospholipid-translocating P-type ATPase [Epithele typhae]|uniref:phospholipid-translocating P-type ATPase n=1 Tax=Epithele typhae TaxID=378194 RepID=UPI002007A0FA|nr:phospholipid-translocating P-type ATPase [Epithele typhae]KAH9942242.1 phospholipid-translocating P-type ATPase [Epithele typhae]
MSDDFVRLVSQANPASRQKYQPANSGYPPASSPNTGQALDPFFDDEDEPDSAFGRSPAMASKESGLPLARSAAPLAGHSQLSIPQTIQPDQWSFDDDQPGAKPFQGSASFPGPSSATRTHARKPSRSFAKSLKSLKWPWQKKEQVLTGTRDVALNNPDANANFCNNYVSTSKYNVATFVPKFLFEQFSKYANLFFLFTALIQQIPDVSPTNRYTTIAPLSVVLLASAFKETQEDLKRHQSDSELNSRLAKVLQSDGTFADKKWKDIMVGDVIRMESDDFIPADVLLIASSEPEGFCYIETSNLDGETNLKIKQASPQTSSLTAPHLVTQLHGTLRSEHPNNSLYTYEGTIDLVTAGGVPKQIPLGPDQLLLRGAQIRNTPWAYGLVVFTGHETKLMRNATAAPIKRTSVERQVNVHIIFLFLFLLALSLGSTIGSSIRTWFFSGQQWYLLESSTISGRAKGFIEDILTFIILYNNLIPISLIVTMEVVKFQQAQLINSDLDMYYAKTDTPALCRTSSLVEELGQIEYVFSDKTGTLTCNEMEFRFCSIGGVAYADVVDESHRGDGDDDKEAWRSFADLRAMVSGGANPFVDVGTSVDPQVAVANEFLTLLAVCHTVIPEIHEGKMRYQASSPDEAALVSGAELLGYQFHTRKPKSVFVNIHGQAQEFEILNVCEFNSTRKRMSTVVRCSDGKIKLFCKGADTVILERLSEGQPFTEKTLIHLEDYATDGFRTLCIAYRDIPEAEYKQWVTIYDQAAATINGRGDALDKAAELIERDMFLLGATAIEDKLQDGVPDTIHTLQMAGIKVWVLTGDRQETAINIGMSCRLISESMNMVIVNEETAHETEAFLSKRLNAIKSQRNSEGDQEDLALIIDGKSLAFALEKDISKIFLELAILCKAVICCRVSPLQKALVVKLVKKNQKAILLAIGDGANDVSMIQAAHVGVGISGVEGLQAARAADVAISQFRFLKKLLLVHGSWSYTRLSKLLLYSFYKNIVLYMTQFWFSFFNNFSGQIAYESWTLSLYNVVFTVLPPLVIGVFDQFVSARILDRYPQLYMLGQRNAFFTRTQFWLWVGNALFHSVITFGFSIILFWGDLKQATGYDSGHWFWGTMLYLAVLLTVLGKAALISDLWTKYTVAAIPGSFIFTMAFLPLYALVAPAIGFSTEYANIVPRLWSDFVFYFVLLLVPILCLTRDFVWKYYKRTYLPETYHIAQEIQKYNIPDYRPRQEQFQKAIKKVRAVQRMRRNRGFAFSQTENASRQDQARLIRAYDTTKTGARPSGY